MRTDTLYARILSLERPWVVAGVDLDEERSCVHVRLDHRTAATFRCPTCGLARPVFDHLPARRWRHLDTVGWATWIEARVPRVQCPTHGVRAVVVPWALPRSRYTMGFERHAIDVLRACHIRGASTLLRLSWDEAWGIMERAVARGQKRKRRRVIARLGVDEKSVAKRHRYVTLVCDLQRGTVEFVAFDRKKGSLDAFYASRTRRQLDGIEAVAMDMWEPFVLSTQANVPGGGDKIVFDRFHIMKHMNEAVDAVRKDEHRRLMANDDATLKKTKYLWLHAAENLSEPDAARFTALKGSNLKTARAWAIKEALRVLWTYRSKAWAKRYWAMWHDWAIRSRLTPVVKAARTIRRHLANVLTYFDHPITNATSEGLNSKIQTLKKTPMATAIGAT